MPRKQIKQLGAGDVAIIIGSKSLRKVDKKSCGLVTVASKDLLVRCIRGYKTKVVKMTYNSANVTTVNDNRTLTVL
jgi:hypothetical protein